MADHRIGHPISLGPCKMLAKLESLAGLIALASFNMHNNPDLTDRPPLRKFKQLQFLDREYYKVEVPYEAEKADGELS